jgi:RNA polymerase sigma factor (sigma-70 family)
MTPRSLLHPARLARKPVLSSQSDERLVDLVRAGYEPAFETIVERYRRPLIGYVRRILPAERAEDAVQQSFVNAYEAIRRDDAELKLRPWLYRIAHNTALNGLRDRSLSEQPLDERIDGVERPDQAFERRQGLAQMIAAVQELPERQRDAIVLRELEGRSYEEISAALSVTGGAVRQLLHRARNTLRTVATAATPVGLLTRIPWAVPAEPVGARVADLCGVGAGALAAKVCATALVTGAVIGGVAVGPGGGDDRRDRGVDQAQAADRDSGRAGAAAPVGLATGRGGDSGRGGSGPDDGGRGGRGPGGHDGDDRGDDRRSGDDDRRGSNSGEGSDDDRGERVEELVERDDRGGGSGRGGGRGGHEDDGDGENSGEGGGGELAELEPEEDPSGSGESGSGDGGVALSGSGVPGGGGSSSGTGNGSGVSGGSGSSGSGSGSGGSSSGSSGSGSGSGQDEAD